MIKVIEIALQQGDFSLSDISFAIPAGQYAILSGATGSGKTSIIEAICGLHHVGSGTILLHDQDITHWHPADRNIGYVPQDSVLFPGMRIKQQIGFSLAMRGIGKAACDERVEELAESFKIANLLNRTPNGLSGGERQRVALARALAFRPRLLCLDEPFSALDEETKQELIDLLKKIQQRQGVTVLHVTHARSEAEQLGTLFFELSNARIEAH